MVRKVLFVIPRMGGGGAERVVARLANAFSREGIQVMVFTLVGKESFYELDTSVELESSEATVSRASAVQFLMSEACMFPRCIWKLYGIMKRGEYDVVISFLREATLLTALCKILGCRFKHICSDRGDPLARTGLANKIDSLVLRHSNLLVCQGEKVAEYYRSVPWSRKAVIPNPIDLDLVPPQNEKKQKRIVAVGRLTQQKNFALLINSFRRVSLSFPEYRLDIFGEGPLRPQLQELIDGYGLGSKVALMGASQEVLQAISDAELFAMTSNYEGFPNALLEAMAVGLPVVCTDFSTGIASELVKGENGIVVPVGDENALSEAICELLADRERRERMGRNNREAAKRYSTPQIASQWIAAMESIFQPDQDRQNKGKDHKTV